MKNFKNLLFIALFFITATVIGQTTISGVIVDESNQPLPGASILEKGTANGTETNFDGKFTLNAKSKSGVLVISYIGYRSREVAFSSSKTNLGTISLEVGGNLLDEIVVVGKGVIDLVQERKTPVAASTIKATEIQTKLGNLEFPEILNTTPSVYATKTSGGYGDSRINVRGFNQSNTAVIINGQPVNDMENGWVYWSNWQGLSDVASGIQIQRGLGASKLEVPSVGGTITIVTKSTDKKEGGTLSSSVGNDGYIKNTIAYNSGLNENGWAASILLGTWQGDGYVDGTQGKGTTYLVSLGYKPSDVHAFNFTFTGAAQWHHQRGTRLSIRDFQNFGGDDEINRRLNADWGTLNGEEYNIRRNFYNKPIGTLNWDWNINDKLSLSTSVYGSWGRGGGTGARGGNFRNRNINVFPFNMDLTEHLDRGNGVASRNADGSINYDNIVSINRSTTSPYTGAPSNYQGMLIGSNGFNSNGVNRAVLIRRASMNSHNWYGAISNLKYESDKWTYSLGLDLRSYEGFHYRVLNDLLGLDGYYSTGNRNLVNGMIQTETITASPFNDTGLSSDKIDYYNVGEVNWQGYNGMIEYNDEDKLSAVLQLGLSNQSYRRIDYFDQPNNVTSDKKSMTGGYVKGGSNYNINDKHNVFFNAGVIKRQPMFDAVFPGFSNNINQDVKNETITSFELGYGFKGTNSNLTVNLYNTVWGDRVVSRNFNDFFGENLDGSAVFENVKQLHQGIEIEGYFKPFDKLKVNAMVSLGNWRYKEDALGTITEVGNPANTGTKTLYLKDAKIGDAAQTTAFLNLDYAAFENFNIDLGWRYAANLYSDFSAIDTTFDTPNNRGALELPSYQLVDLGLGYKLEFKNQNSLKFRLNVNNLFDTVYISEASTSIFVGDTSPTVTNQTGSGVWNGIDTRNNVWFGFGRTWNLSVRYNF